MLPLIVLEKRMLLKMEWVMKEKMKNIICKTVIFLCVMLLCAGIVGNYDVKNVQAKTVVREITIGKGKSYALSEDFTISKKASYKTSNKKVATARNGKITGKKYGKAKVTVRNNGKTYVYKVTVSKVYLTKQNVKLNVKKSATVKVKGAKGKVKWTSSNKKVATVKNGKIVAKKKGKAVVTAKVKATGAVLKCQVTVTTGSGNTNSGNGNNNAGNTGNGDNSDNTGNNDNNGDNTGGNTDNGGGNNDNNNGGGDNNGNTGDNGNTTPVDPEPVKEPYLAVYSEASGNMEPVSELNWNFGDETYTYIYLVNADSTVTWTSSDAEIARVSGYGDYASLRNSTHGGKATITATYDGKTYSCEITSYLLYDTGWNLKEGMGFDYEELKEDIENAGTTEKIIDVQEPLEWSRTDLIKKNVTQDGSYTHYTVEGSGDTVITGMTEDGYTKVVLTITSTGKYIEKQGTYDENLTNEVYELLKLEETRNTNSESVRYSMPEDQLEFLLKTADRWYNGEISERVYHNLAMYTSFENVRDNITDYYGNKIYSTCCTCTQIKLEDSKTAENIAKDITKYMGFDNIDPAQQGGTWGRDLLYLKIHTDGNNVYVYMIP